MPFTPGETKVDVLEREDLYMFLMLLLRFENLKVCNQDNIPGLP